MKKVITIITVLLAFVSSAHSITPAEEKILFQTLGEIKGELKQINRRIDDVNKRIDDVNRRIDDVSKQLSKRIDNTNRKIEELKSDMNARFEQVDKRFEQHFKYIELMVIGMFGLVATFVGLLLWDRKTMIGEAKRQIYEEMDSEVRPEKLKRLLKSLREIAKVDKRIAEILKKEGLL